MGVQARKGGQQRGVDVDEATLVVRHKTGRQNTHKASQHHQIRCMAVNHLHQLDIKGLAAIKLLVIQHFGGNAVIARKDQSFGVSLVADHGRDPGVVLLCPVLLLGCTHNGGHVRAAARDQDHDVFHGRRLSH